jgi:transmembrane 9 superfamily protein 2/4
MYMIVGFEVSPCSIKRTPGKPVEHLICDSGDKLPPFQEVKEGEKIMYTYDVYWEKNENIKWASRWDSYLRMPGGKVHWFSILNSLLIVLVMASLVAMILIRTIRRDLAKYEQLMVDSSADMKDEAGWKLLTGDVFRSPNRGKGLAVHVSRTLCSTGLGEVGVGVVGVQALAWGMCQRRCCGWGACSWCQRGASAWLYT